MFFRFGLFTVYLQLTYSTSKEIGDGRGKLNKVETDNSRERRLQRINFLSWGVSLRVSKKKGGCSLTRVCNFSTRSFHRHKVTVNTFRYLFHVVSQRTYL